MPDELSPTVRLTEQHPSPALDINAFDHDCSKFLYWKAVQEGAKKEADAYKEKIVAGLIWHGKVPDNAPRSRRVASSAHVATMTIGTSVEVDDDAAAAFEQLLKELRLSRFMGKIFTSRREYSLVKDAHRFITNHKWPAKVADQIRLAYLRCFSAKTNAPSLIVETQEEITRRAEAGLAELATKASKAGKKAA